MGLYCPPLIRAPLLGKRLCLRCARQLDDILICPLRPGVCPRASFEGQLRVENPFAVAGSLLEGFDDGEGRRLFVRYVDEAARKAFRAFLLTISLARYRTYLSGPIGTPTTVTIPSSAIMDMLGDTLDNVDRGCVYQR